MTIDLSRDPERDARLADRLREAAPEPAVDWVALQGRITGAAEIPLARLRRRPPSRFAPLLRTLLPLAAAAGLAGAYVALRPSRGMTERDRAMVDQMVEASVPESVDQLITGEAAQGALLEIVAGS